MGWFIAGLVIAYLVGVRIVARRYFARRHGVSLETGEVGVMRAVWVGSFWPIAIWLPAVRSPGRCSHHKHVIERARMIEEIRLVEQLRNEGT